MELLFLFFLLLPIATLFFLVVVTNLRSNKNLPPQPWKLPLIGHLHHLSSQLPHLALANLAQKLGPVFRLQLGQVSAVVISSPSSAQEILKTHDLTFLNRPKLLSAEIIGYNYKDIVFSPYGDYWRQMRKICILELLSAKKVRSFRPIREQESWSLVKSMGSKKINLTEKILTMMNAIACRVAVGSRCKDQAELLALIGESLLLSSGFDVTDLFPSIKILHRVTGTRNKLVKLHKKIDKILDGIISEHQGEGSSKEKEDLMDVLLRLRADGGLEFPITYDNIKAVILDMFFGGTDTSSVTIEWAMSELMRNPRVMKKAQAELRQALKGKKEIHESDIQELDYLKLVIKETLRLHPPVPLLVPRESRDKCEIGGYHIPVNTKVFVNVWKMGRDPDHWKDPESFIPERFSDDSINFMGGNFEYLPFGGGRRMCPGLLLGLANTELPLAMLLYHFDWELPNGANVDMSESLGATLKRKFDLFLVPTRYNTNDNPG